MYTLTEEQKKLRTQVRSFADHELLPLTGKLEESGGFTPELFRKLGKEGFLDLSFLNRRPEAKYTGISSAIVLEEIARGLPSLAMGMSPHIQCANLIALHGEESLRRRVVPSSLRGETLLAFALSEATGGSDALAIKTTAVQLDDGWILNGEKCWITNAGAATGYIIAARDKQSSRSRDISLFYVDAQTPGLNAETKISMIGMNNCANGIITLTDCHVPSDCLIGSLHEAFDLMKVLLNEGRFDMATLGVGIAQGAMECAVRYSNETGRFGRNLSSYQGISFQAARMYEKIFVARSALYQVASLFENGELSTPEVAALKLYASEMCLEVTRAAVQLHGARGLVHASLVERYFRDAQLLTISEGSSEICQIVISRRLYNGSDTLY